MRKSAVMPGRTRRSVGRVISRETRRATAARAFELALYLMFEESVELIPMAQLEGMDEAELEREVEEIHAGRNFLPRDQFGNTYLARPVPADRYAPWERAFAEYEQLATRMRQFPIGDRESFLQVLASGLASVARGSGEADAEDPLVRLVELAEPLGFTPAEAADRLRICRWHASEFLLEDEEEDDDEAEDGEA